MRLPQGAASGNAYECHYTTKDSSPSILIGNRINLVLGELLPVQESWRESWCCHLVANCTQGFPYSNYYITQFSYFLFYLLRSPARTRVLGLGLDFRTFLLTLRNLESWLRDFYWTFAAFP